MKKFVILGGLLAVVCLLATNACNRSDTSTNPPLTKDSIKPDSVRGDTTYYSYDIRDTLLHYQDSTWPTRPTILGTFGGFWHYYAPASRWTFVRNTVSLTCTSNDDSLLRKAEDIIRGAGGLVWAHPPGIGFYYVAATVFTKTVPDSVQFLDFLAALDQHPEVFRYVAPWPRFSVQETEYYFPVSDSALGPFIVDTTSVLVPGSFPYLKTLAKTDLAWYSLNVRKDSWSLIDDLIIRLVDPSDSTSAVARAFVVAHGGGVVRESQLSDNSIRWLHVDVIAGDGLDHVPPTAPLPSILADYARDGTFIYAMGLPDKTSILLE